MSTSTNIDNNQVPKEWMLDPDWDIEPKEPFQMSYNRKFPRWQMEPKEPFQMSYYKKFPRWQMSMFVVL